MSLMIQYFIYMSLNISSLQKKVRKKLIFSIRCRGARASFILQQINATFLDPFVSQYLLFLDFLQTRGRRIRIIALAHVCVCARESGSYYRLFPRSVCGFLFFVQYFLFFSQCISMGIRCGVVSGCNFVSFRGCVRSAICS